MKQITVFETVEELLDAACRIRSKDEERTFLPVTVYLEIDQDDRLSLAGEESERFALSEEVTMSDDELYAAALKRCGLRIEQL